MNNYVKSSIVSLITIVVFIPISLYVVTLSGIYAIYHLATQLPHTIYNKLYNE